MFSKKIDVTNKDKILTILIPFMSLKTFFSNKYFEINADFLVFMCLLFSIFLIDLGFYSSLSFYFILKDFGDYSYNLIKPFIFFGFLKISLFYLIIEKTKIKKITNY